MAALHPLDTAGRGGAGVPVPLEAPAIVPVAPARRAVGATRVRPPEARAGRVRAQPRVAGLMGKEIGASRSPTPREKARAARTATVGPGAACQAEGERHRLPVVPSSATVGGVRRVLAVAAPGLRPVPIARRHATAGGVAARRAHEAIAGPRVGRPLVQVRRVLARR